MSEHAFDPAVVRLLEEICRDPRAGLLRAPQERLQRWLGEPGDAITPHGSFLTKAERHLVTAYREQAAGVLHAASLSKLLSKPESGVFLESSRRPDIGATYARARRLTASSDGATREALRLFTEPEVTASRLAAASLQLVPNDNRRITFAVSQDVQGRRDSAKRVLERLLQTNPSMAVRDAALQSLGCMHCAERKYTQALECLRLASGRWQAIASRLTVELQLGNSAGALQADQELALSGADPVELGELIAFVAQSRKAGFWMPRRKAWGAALTVRHLMTDVGKQLCDVMRPPTPAAESIQIGRRARIYVVLSP